MAFAGLGFVAILLLGICVLVLGYVIFAYNRLVTFRNRCDNGWSQIDVQLKKRADLVPNLVETVKGYAAHEKGVFEEVAKARSGYMNAQGVAETGRADGDFTKALKSLFAVAENYPELKADKQFLLLQEQLDGIESKIAYSRQFYNDVVLAYTNITQLFPGSIIAGVFNFPPREYYKVAETDREPVKVKF
ncbi:MAG: LemA family protein [Candidatus Firestonebacteria bacterium]